MFTGLIQHLGRIEGTGREGDLGRLRVDLGPLADSVIHGASVAVNGVCLTVTERNGTVARFDVLLETLSRSTLSRLGAGDEVNLELSLRAGDPLGGHFVLGHVDGVGTIRGRRDLGKQWEFEIAAPESVLAPTVEKGSIAVDGISLTVARLSEDSFTVAIIPETFRRTTLGRRAEGDPVNLEADVLGKTVARLLGRTGVEGLTMDRLRDAGF